MMEKETQCATSNGKERVYNFLVEFIRENGFPPSVREIGSGCGLKSTATVRDYLEMLEMMGKIEVKRKITRGIRLVGYEFRKVEE